MKETSEYITNPIFNSRNTALLFVVFLLFAGPAVFAQNTKGDKPGKQSPILRFPKIKRHSKGGDRPNTRDISGRRSVRTKNFHSTPQVVINNKRPESQRLKGSNGNYHSSPPRFKVRVRSVSAQRARNNVFPQKGPYVHNSVRRPSSKPRTYSRSASGKPIIRSTPQNNQRAWGTNLKGGSIGVGSASRSWITRGRKDVYWGKFSKGERPITRDLTGRNVRTKNFHSLSPGVGRSDTGKQVLRRPSAEGSNPSTLPGGYSSISGGGRAWTTDISGHRLRRRLAQQGKRGRGLFSGFRSASGRGSNEPLPVRRPGMGAGALSKMLHRQNGKKTFGGGAAEVGTFRGDQTKEDVFPPFSSAGLGYSGRIKRRRSFRGGESVSGKVFNNSGRPLQSRAPGGSVGTGSFQGNLRRDEVSTKGYSRDGSGFSGNIRSARPLKGGGSVSGKVFNNGGRPLQGRPPGNGAWAIGSFRGALTKDDLEPRRDGGVGYSGFSKGKRPLKGGGSVSGRFFNNGGHPLQGRPPGNGAWAIGSFRGALTKDDIEPSRDGGVGYSGFIKGRRPLKGGGSVSGRFFNNDGNPLRVQPPGRGSWPISGYSGTLKGHRPLKGGGSVSGRFFNNDGKPLMVQPPGRGSWPISGYSGTLRGHKPLKGGGSISGRYLSNDGNPVRVRPPGRDSWGIPGFQGHLKATKPARGGGSISGRLWNNNEKPITVQGANSDEENYFRGKIPLSLFKKYYVKNPHSADAALKKRKPSPVSKTIGGLTTKRTRPDYVKNPSSNKKALVTWSPGVAYARLKDYQGNMKMTKLTNSRLHPDSKFAHGNRDNVKSERTLSTNIKLLWAKIFKKNGGQPETVKEKKLVPRYDKKEKELWKALYD